MAKFQEKALSRVSRAGSAVKETKSAPEIELVKNVNKPCCGKNNGGSDGGRALVCMGRHG